ncbi:hypothetical protein Csa_009734 [Cucumis sativus]|uniref:Uncharacterized protein n=1 Tax=Cucumis sativus TaxID=3659 RepID=A0A0A0L9L4_CUCSA|nr:hypothetical protein Csa_009734 [Cucumis sativus]
MQKVQGIELKLIEKDENSQRSCWNAKNLFSSKVVGVLVKRLEQAYSVAGLDMGTSTIGWRKPKEKRGRKEKEKEEVTSNLCERLNKSTAICFQNCFDKID